MESRDENDRELNGLRIISTENETHGVSATLHYPIVTEPRRKTSPGYSNRFSTFRRGYSTIQVCNTTYYSFLHFDTCNLHNNIYMFSLNKDFYQCISNI